MWEFIFELLPVLAFLSGTLLGGLIIFLFNRERSKSLENQYKESSNANMALGSQLVSKSRLEDDLARTNSEIEKLRQQIDQLGSMNTDSNSSLMAENEALRKRLKKQSKPTNISSKNYVNDYQLFLVELEKSIKKAKKKSFVDPIDLPIKEKKKIKTDKKKKRSKKEKSKAKAKSKYDFYKNKYSGKSTGKGPFTLDKSELKKTDGSATLKQDRDLTYLFGINAAMQEILNRNHIKTFTDLSLTKIAELKAILASEGEEFENIDPLNWPIQARIAEKGQWEILDEYKSKMNM